MVVLIAKRLTGLLNFINNHVIFNPSHQAYASGGSSCGRALFCRHIIFHFCLLAVFMTDLNEELLASRSLRAEQTAVHQVRLMGLAKQEVGGLGGGGGRQSLITDDDLHRPPAGI